MDRWADVTDGITDGGPRESKFVINSVDLVTIRVAQGDRLTAILQTSRPRAEASSLSEFRLHRGRVLGDDEETVCRDRGSDPEGVTDTSFELPANQADWRSADVNQFDEFGGHRFVVLIVMDLVDYDGRWDVDRRDEGERGSGPLIASGITGERTEVVD